MKSKLPLLTWFGLVSAYFATRLINLKIIPIFTDEAIYSYWAQVALHDPANRFMSLEDGKQPLFIWIAAIFQKFIADPLVAGRLVSVFAGFGSIIGIYFLSKELFNQKVAKVAALLYVILPFTLLYDRMALFDSLLTMFGIYSVFLAIKIVRQPRLDLALINGFVIGLAMITKSSANFFLYLIPATLLFFDFKEKQILSKFIKWLSATFATIVLALIIYNSLRLSPLFYMISRKNLEFIRSFNEVFNNPFLHFRGNLNSILTWLVDYLGLPLAVLVLATTIFGLYKFQKQTVLLLAYIIFPLIAILFFNQVLYPRFALFYFPYIIILISSGFVYLASKYKKFRILIFVIFGLSTLIPLYSSFKLLTDPPNSLITKADKGQYLNDWPAGYGVKEIVKILKEEVRNHKVYVGTEGTFGLLPYALQIYFYGSKDIQIVGFWPVREIPQPVLEVAKAKKTYFIFNENQNLPDEPKNPSLKLIGKYQKGIGNSFMRLYEIIPQ